MIHDTLKITGKLRIALYGPDGALKQEHNVKNMVVTAGKVFIAERIVGTPTVMSHMAIGNGNTAADEDDTTLAGPQLARVSLTSSTVPSGSTVRFVAAFPAGTGTGQVREAGVFNAGTGGTMLCRTVFAEVNKGADDSMTITWDVTVS
jgi:hypothetical protein